MKKHSKFLALVLALTVLLAFAMPITANAAQTTSTAISTGSITINPPASGLLNLTAANFKGYKLFNLVAINGTIPYTPYEPGVDPSTVGNSAHFVYEPAAWLASFLTWAAGRYAAAANPYGTDVELFREILQDHKFDDAYMVQLAKDLAIYESLGGTISTAIPAAQAGTSIKFNGLDYGYYLVVGTAYRNDRATLDTAKDAVITRGMLFNIPEEVIVNGKVTALEKDPERTLKADAPTLDKDVMDDDWGKSTTKNIGDIIDYRITVKIPNEHSMKAYDLSTYVFKIHDTMSAGLTLEKSTGTFSKADLTVTVNGTPLAAADYDLQTGTTPTDWFTIQILPATFVAGRVGAGDTIVVTYKARLNKNAIIDDGGNKNTAYLEYSNNPHAGGTGQTPEVEPKVYTFDIHVKKVDGEKDTIPLAGAKFKLYRDNAGTAAANPIEFVAHALNEYRIPDATEGAVTKVTEVTTDATGAIRFLGLDAGVYWLEESQAPTGYNKLANKIKIEILKNGFVRFFNEDQDLTASQKGWVNVDVCDGDDNEIKIKNHTGGILPGTGGIGTYLFFGGGAVLAFLFILALVAYKRKKTLSALNG